MSSVPPQNRSRAAAMLLHHVFSARHDASERPCPRCRLEQLAGRELTDRLLTALVGDHRMRPRDFSLA